MKWPRPEPLDAAPAAQPPPERYCDLVLTGGVTDGIVYPWAVIELARAYHFKNIGGTSVGAMAAALTAAAEFGRRNGSVDGFNEVMLKVPEWLAEDVDKKNGKGRTRIFSLFQPAATTKRLFDFFVDLIGSGNFSLEGTAKKGEAEAGPVRIVVRVLLALFRAYRFPARAGAVLGLIVAVLAVLLGLHPLAAPFLALAAALVLSLALVVWQVYCDLSEGLMGNHYGLCTGHRAGDPLPSEPSLIEWLHQGIQGAAGRDIHQPPLTFQDLWEADEAQAGSPGPPGRKRKARAIDLRMIATNLTHVRPYEFPLQKDDPALFFKAAELRPFFPDSVIEYLKKTDPSVDPKDENALRALPRARLPVLVAARLSLSFPILFSAIPLWAIDHESSRKPGEIVYGRCRFSDGGICSNFPIHLFDAAVPEWPTFGISLVSKTAERKPVWLSRYHGEGRTDSWHRFDKPGGKKGSLAGFLIAILYSAKDWHDKTSTQMPGVRDRIVHIALSVAGSLNLKLSPKDMLKLALFGRRAGKKLVRKFIQHGRPAAAWDEHRWVRFHTFIAGLRERIQLLGEAVRNPQYGTPLAAQIVAAQKNPPLDEKDPAAERTLSAAQARDLEALLDALQALERQFAQAALPQPYQPEPEPNLQIRPPL